MSTIKNEIMNQTSDNESVLEKFINIPGLQHLAENIFLNLKYRDLEACRLVKASFQLILDQLMENPLFWLERFLLGEMSRKNHMDWLEIIQMTRGTNVGETILLYLKLYGKNERVIDFDVPCYLMKENLEKYSEIIIKVKDRNISKHSLGQAYYQDEIVKIPLEENVIPMEFIPYGDEMSLIEWASLYGHTEIVQLLAPFTDNLEDQYRYIIQAAAYRGQTDIVKILAPLTDNPNAPDEDGKTPIYSAARYGHSEIVKILAPLTDNPNAPNRYGFTPINGAVDNGHTEIVKILAPLIDNPNAPNRYGYTPIYFAARNGHIEIVKILAPLTDNPNFPDKHGRTPSEVATNVEIKDLILEYSSEKCSVGRFTKDVSKKLA